MAFFTVAFFKKNNTISILVIFKLYIFNINLFILPITTKIKYCYLPHKFIASSKHKNGIYNFQSRSFNTLLKYIF